ncbi:MAG: hypothetical protein Q7V19_14570 [Bacteroidales bacterium]|nr:hypothetical protein [Bacteroidales bacterium]MDP2236736.1 hypothetical protein [Bacteroidales bacterium]
MKTQNLTLALIFSIFFQSVIFADGFRMKEESYIDDIPFNTTEIFDAHNNGDTSIVELTTPAEESFIDDIPFNTEKIAGEILSAKAMAETFTLCEESYIDDIPFDTKIIAYRYLSRKTNANSSSILRFIVFSGR